MLPGRVLPVPRWAFLDLSGRDYLDCPINNDYVGKTPVA
jgi:hypothetical protein